MHKTLTLLIITLLLGALTGSGRGLDRKAVSDSLRAILPRLTTPADSLHIYNNLFDVSARYSKEAFTDTIYALASRAGDAESALDILRNMANRAVGNDSLLDDYRDKALTWPDSWSRKETLTFINMSRYYFMARHAPDSVRERYVNRLIDELNSAVDANDTYRRIEINYGIVHFMSRANAPQILINQYVDSLEMLIKRLPASAYALRNSFLITVSAIYGETDHKRTFEAEKAILESIRGLKEYYHSRGRDFRDYGLNCYNSYSNMLMMCEFLSPREIEEYYRLARQTVEADSSLVPFDLKYRQPDIFYARAKGDWATVRDIIKGLEHPLPYFYYPTLFEAADSLGDGDIYARYAPEYIQLLEGQVAERNIMDNLGLAYALYTHKTNLSVDSEAKSERLRRVHWYILNVSVVVILLLLGLVMVIWRLYIKNRHMARSLEKSNRQLLSDQEELSQSRQNVLAARDRVVKANTLQAGFIRNMSREVERPLTQIATNARMIVDTAMAMGSRHLSRVAQSLELNTELLSTVVGDVLRMSELDNSGVTLPVQRQMFPVRPMAESAVAGIRHRLQPGVRLNICPDCPPAMDIYSDQRRVQQIVNALLSNAAKFTHRGEVTLSWRDSGQAVEISVTDTGIGINPDNKEKIFGRFVKLDPATQGAGLGLTIARIIAERLGGKLYLDTLHTGPGARFVLSLPKT